MKKMKRVLVALLSCLTAFACLAGTVACGKDEKKDSASTPNTSVSVESPADSSSEAKEESSDVEVESSEVEVESSEVEDESSEVEVESSEVEVESSEVEKPETPHDCAVDGHNMADVPAIYPTCTTSGRAATIGCTVCDYVLDPAPEMPVADDYLAFDKDAYEKAWQQYNAYWAAWKVGGTYAIRGEGQDVYGHAWSKEAVKEVKATCCEAGVKAYYTCEYCDNIKVVGKGIVTADKAEEALTILATGAHKYESFIHAVEPTCVSDGCTEGWVCANSGVEVVSEFLPALGHNTVFSEDEADDENKYVGSKAATCTAKAYCGVCKASYGELADHELSNVDAKAVTCASNGWDAYEYCVNCTYTTFTEITSKEHWAAQFALGEDVGYVKVGKVAATCTDAGNIDYYACNGCDEGFYKSVSKTAKTTTIEAVTKKALGHNISATKDKDAYVAPVAATCVTDGCTKGGYCTRCETTVVSETIPATGHNYVYSEKEATAENKYVGSKPATCTTDAYCGQCRKYLNDKNTLGKDKVPVADAPTRLGHTWEEVAIVYASCTENGVAAHYECSVCKDLGLDLAADVEDKDANDDGKKVVKIAALTIKAFGHSMKVDEEGKVIVIPAKLATCGEDGWNAYSECARCSYTTKKVIPADPALHDSIVLHANLGLKGSCSEYLRCETFALVDNNKDNVIDENDIYDVNEDGVIDAKDNVHVGCDKEYINPVPVADRPDHIWNEDKICTLCGACDHKDADNNGVCDNCGKCSHKNYLDSVCTECGYECVSHVWDKTNAAKYECTICDKTCAHESHTKDLKCALCKVYTFEKHEYAAATGKCACGVACEHKYLVNNTDATAANDNLCDICDFVCDHNLTEQTATWFDGKCACGALACPHTEHDADSLCTKCGKEDESFHSFAYDAEEVALKCACGLTKDVCKHEEHEQQLTIKCSNEKCDGYYPLPEHTFDMDNVSESGKVQCTVCDYSAKYYLVCTHENHDVNLTCEDENCKLTLAEQQAKNCLYVAKHVYGENEECTCSKKIADDTSIDSSKVVLIKDAEDLVDFAKEVNAGDSFSGKTVMLLADIDLTDVEWAPIGKDHANAFRGTFDGCGKTISGLTVEGDFAGFFGYMYGTVQNLTIDGAEVSGKTKIGVIAGYSYGSIIGCTVKNATVNCIDDSATATDGDGDKAGAIVGYLAEGATSVVMNNTVENVVITANRDAGWVVGCANKNSVVEGNVSISVKVVYSEYGTGKNIGGEIGRDMR